MSETILKRYLTTDEVALYTGIKKGTLVVNRSEGRGFKYIQHGGRILYDRLEIDAALAKCAVSPQTRVAQRDAASKEYAATLSGAARQRYEGKLAGVPQGRAGKKAALQGVAV